MLIAKSDQPSYHRRSERGVLNVERCWVSRTRPVFRSTRCYRSPRKDVAIFRIDAARCGAQVSVPLNYISRDHSSLSPFRLELLFR